MTECEISRIYELTAEQVAAARAYVLNHPDTVLAEHLKIEERMQAGNPPEVIERAEKARSVFTRFKQWLEKNDTSIQEAATQKTGRFPTFREWLAEQEGRRN
jgi:hypothetical protein